MPHCSWPLWSLLSLLVLCLPISTQAADTTDATPVRVMSYNIRYDAASDTGSADWTQRRDKVASMIRFHGADVVGTQEGQLHQVMDLEKRLPGYEWIGIGRDSGGGEFTAIFYRQDRLTLLAHDTFWLSTSPTEPGSKSWDAALPRIATWARFRDQTTGDSLFVLNTHFDHEGAEARRNSATMIAESVGGLARGLPAVVMGDFNAMVDSEPYEALTQSDVDKPLHDAKEKSELSHHGPLSTFNNFQPTVIPDRRIDYIFVSSDVTVRRHGHLNEKWDGQYPSDHLPVLAEVLIHPGD